MLVGRQLARMDRSRKRRQRSGETKHGIVELRWMSAPSLIDVPQLGEEAVDRVQKPEARNIGNAEFREAQIFLTPAPGERGALRGENLHEAARDGHQVIARTQVDERRHEVRIELVVAARRTTDACDAKRAVSLERLTAEDDAEVAARDLNRTLGLAGRLVTAKELFGAIPRVALLIEPRDIVTVVSVFRHAKVDVEPFLIGRERALELLRRRRALGQRHVEQQTVGQNARGGRQREAARGQRFPIDLESLETPRTECQR